MPVIDTRDPAASIIDMPISQNLISRPYGYLILEFTPTRSMADKAKFMIIKTTVYWLVKMSLCSSGF